MNKQLTPRIQKDMTVVCLLDHLLSKKVYSVGFIRSLEAFLADPKHSLAEHPTILVFDDTLLQIAEHVKPDASVDEMDMMFDVMECVLPLNIPTGSNDYARTHEVVGKLRETFGIPNLKKENKKLKLPTLDKATVNELIDALKLLGAKSVDVKF